MKFQKNLFLKQTHKHLPILLAFAANTANFVLAHGGNTSKIHACVKTSNSSIRIVGEEVSLRNTNFIEANVAGVTRPAFAALDGAIWSNTTCPDGTNSDNNGNTCEEHPSP